MEICKNRYGNVSTLKLKKLMAIDKMMRYKHKEKRGGGGDLSTAHCWGIDGGEGVVM